MKHDPTPPTVAPATLQDVIDRVAGRSLPGTRKRDLLSAVATFGKLTDRPPAAIPLDLAEIRRTLDAMVPVQAKVSRKRWANRRRASTIFLDKMRKKRRGVAMSARRKPIERRVKRQTNAAHFRRGFVDGRTYDRRNRKKSDGIADFSGQDGPCAGRRRSEP